ncbi:hypothetical protein Csa_004649 [Cucumis sativus]|nr:hypothetical protein Csa_004649 [Cucumis sativus]
MEIIGKTGLLFGLAFLWLWAFSCEASTSKDLTAEVQVLMGIKAGLKDPHSVLSWDENAVDAFSQPEEDSHDNLLLQNNNISGNIPKEITKITKLHTLDLSNNSFSGEIPSTFSNMKSLQYLSFGIDIRRLNNNTLSGPIPTSLANMTQLTLLDLSYNNLSSPVPRLLAKTFNFTGNYLICSPGTKEVCYGTTPLPLSFAVPNSTYFQPPRRHSGQRIALVIGLSLSCICLFTLAYGFFSWRKHRHNQQIFFEANDWHRDDHSLGNIKRFQFRELQNATHNFSSKNLVGKGGFGNVYKGYLQDGTIVAVKRLKDGNAMRGEIQFQTEVEMISLAVHRNLLRLYGFCMTETERLLVYPYMSNGSVATRLKAKPALDWGTRKRIALGAARGLLYLHEQCDPKIIHRDVKAANILLDDFCEAVVGDFGLAKLLDHRDSHVTTAVRGTVGHIAPEYLSTGQSSEKTDVFGFGILLLELISGQRALEFGKAANQKGAILDWVKKIHQEKKLEMLVDKDLRSNYDRIELEEIVRVALLCIQYLPSHRPKMSEVVRMLEGDGLAEKWEASQRAEASRSRANEFSSSERYSDLTDDSSLFVQAIQLSGPR